MLEEIIAKVLEQSIVAGGFLFLLYHVLHKQDKLLTEFAKELKSNNRTMIQISNTLKTFDARLQKLEEKRNDENAS